MDRDLMIKAGNERSSKAYWNIFALFTLKGISMLIGFLLVPVTLTYLDPARYGIWLTLSAVFNWFSLFDIGLGNGLRNRLAEALASGDKKTARVYISTSYAALTLIFLAVFLIFLAANSFINWPTVLNTGPQMQGELRLLAAVVFFFFCIRFVSQLISTVAQACQEPAFALSIEVTGRALSFLLIILFPFLFRDSLLNLGIALAAVPVLISIFASFIIFRTRYKDLKPSLSMVKMTRLRDIMNLGVKFFILQVSAIMFYQTNNFIISHLFGPEEVTPYNIGMQYFSIATFAFTTILAPYWSAFTDAFARQDVDWIRSAMNRLKLAWIGLATLVVVLFFFSRQVVALWVGNEIEVSRELYLTLAVYVLVNAFNGIYSHFLNGIGKVMVQLYMGLVFTILYIPLGIYFGQQFGMKGIIYPTIVYGIITAIILEMQYRKVIRGTASGVWSK